MNDKAIGASGDNASFSDSAASNEESGKTKKSKKKNSDNPGFFGKIFLFLRQVVAELKKVVRPTRSELLNYVGVVLVFVCFMMLLVFLLDLGWSKLMFLIFSN